MNEQNRVIETDVEKEKLISIETEKQPGETEQKPEIDKEAMENFEMEMEQESENPHTDKSQENDIILGEIAAKLNVLNENMEHLKAEFKSKIKYDQHKEKIIDDLHREVQDYKNDLIKNLLEPVIMDIIHTVDDTNKLVDNHRAKDTVELDPLKLIKQMEGIASDLEDILSRQGVEPFNCEQEEFDPGQQKIIKTEAADDQSKDRTISKRIHKGYMWNEKVLRREMVNVYVYKPGSEDPETNKNKE